MVSKLYEEAFIPGKSTDGAFKAKEVAFYCLGKHIVTQVDAAVVRFKRHLTLLVLGAGVCRLGISKMCSRSPHESSAVL